MREAFKAAFDKAAKEHVAYDAAIDRGLAAAIAAQAGAIAQSTPEGEAVYVVFDGPPGPESGRFVDVETRNGRGLSVGEWSQRGNYWTLGPVYSAPPQSFQTRVHHWMMACFGAEIAADKSARNHRFFEESTELVQSLGMTASEAHQLVDYVYGRPAGEPKQESGGVSVTHAALCLANDIDMNAAAEAELARIWTKVEVIRAKQAAKPKHSPLPAAPAMPESMKDIVRTAIASALGDAYDCTRVWQAWSYGTMSPDDFSLVAEDSDRLNEITDAVIQVLPAVPEDIVRDAAKYRALNTPEIADFDGTTVKASRQAVEEAADLIATRMSQTIQDTGPWRASKESADAVKGVFVESNNFDHDVRLYVNGDFADVDQRFAYARGIANSLNAASAQQQPVGEVRVSGRADSGRWLSTVILTADLPVGTKVYAAPPAPAVPDGWRRAMDDALSACQSVSTGRGRRIVRDDCVLYLQTEEWCEWLQNEVAPKLRAVLAAAPEVSRG